MLTFLRKFLLLKSQQFILSSFHHSVHFKWSTITRHCLLFSKRPVPRTLVKQFTNSQSMLTVSTIDGVTSYRIVCKKFRWIRKLLCNRTPPEIFNLKLQFRNQIKGNLNVITCKLCNLMCNLSQSGSENVLTLVGLCEVMQYDEKKENLIINNIINYTNINEGGKLYLLPPD